MPPTPDADDPAPTILRVIADRIREGGPDATGWLRVLRVYQSGRRAYPDPFQPRRPAREARRTDPQP